MTNRQTAFRVVVLLFLVMMLAMVGESLSAGAAQAQSSIPLHLAWASFDPLRVSPESLLPTSLLRDDYEGGETGYYIVQLNGPVQEADKGALTALGAELLDYIPDYAFIVHMSSAAAAQVRMLDEVRWLGIYQPGFRLSQDLIGYAQLDPGLEESSPADLTAEQIHGGILADPLDLSVLVFPREDLDEIAQQIQRLGGSVLEISRSQWRGKIHTELPPALLPYLVLLDGISWIEPAPQWELHNEKAHVDGIMDVEDVWTRGYYGEGQIVAIADSQLDTGNPSTVVQDFKDCTTGTTPRVTISRLGSATEDFYGHGTHVSGSVLGNGRMDGATCGNYAGHPAGSAPEANAYFQAIMDTSGGLGGIPGDLNDLFQPAFDFGARIHTNSWGSAVMGLYTASSQEADQFSWDHESFLIHFSAGNEGADIDADGVIDLHSIGSPGTAKNVFTVGASENNGPGGGTWTYWYTPVAPIYGDDYADDVNGLAPFSSRGPADDGRTKPDIVAPGIWVNSVWSTQDPDYDGSEDYIRMGGTSMSTPLVAGASALARQVFSAAETYTPTAAMLKSLIANRATDIYPGQYGTGAGQEIPITRPTYQAGWGRVDLEDALFASHPDRIYWWDISSSSPIVDSYRPLATGEAVTYTFEVSISLPLAATLAWTDYPGALAAGGGLVNDLDLRIDGPGGPYYANNARQRESSELLAPAESWNAILQPRSGQRYAMRLTPSQYPAVPAFAKLWFYNNGNRFAGSVNFDLRLYGDNSGGAPGSLLCTISGKRAAWDSSVGGYPVIVDLSSCGTTINSGDFYLSIEFTSRAPNQTGFVRDSSPTGRAWSDTGSGWVHDTTYDYAWEAVVYTPTTPTPFDRVNNLVGIDLPSPSSGVYTLTIAGHNIPYGPQPYALTLSGDLRLLGTETVTRAIPALGTYKFGNTGVTIEFTDESLEAVAVTVYRDQYPNTYSSDVVKRYYRIMPIGGGSFTANLTFSYEQAEFAAAEGNLAESEIDLWRWDGSSWEHHSASSRDPEGNQVTLNGVTAFSAWALGSELVDPTAITLSAARTLPGKISPLAVGLLLGIIVLLSTVMLWSGRRR